MKLSSPGAGRSKGPAAGTMEALQSTRRQPEKKPPVKDQRLVKRFVCARGLQLSRGRDDGSGHERLQVAAADRVL
jgi:hypothetical protein